MHIGDKIKALRKDKKLTQNELAKILSVQPTAISAWESGRNKPLIDKVNLMAERFGIPTSFFFDDYVQEDEKKKEVSETISPYISVIRNTTPNVLDLPIVGKISCGNGTIAYEEIEGFEATPSEWLNGGEYFYLRAKGDSMINARIQEGDLLLIRKQEEVENGEIAAVLIDDEAVLKRVYKNNGTLLLQSENPKYQPILITNEKKVNIIGKLKKVVFNL